jgi:hypothetical protein
MEAAMADNFNTPTLRRIKPMSRRSVVTGAAVALTTVMIAAPVAAAVPTFEEVAEQVASEMESWGYSFVVVFQNGEICGLITVIADVRHPETGDTSHSGLRQRFHDLWDTDKKQLAAHLARSGRPTQHSTTV